MTNSNISQAANLLNRGASANNSQINTSIRQDGQGNAVDLDLLEEDAQSDVGVSDAGRQASAESRAMSRVLGDKYSTRALGPRRGTRCVDASPLRAPACLRRAT